MHRQAAPDRSGCQAAAQGVCTEKRSQRSVDGQHDGGHGLHPQQSERVSGPRGDRLSLTPHNSQFSQRGFKWAADAGPLFRHNHAACWLVLIGYLLDLADGAVARQLNACSALGK